MNELKKLLIGLLLGLGCCGAMAEEWTFLGDSNGFNLYIGKVNRTGIYPKAWTKFEFKKYQIVSGKKVKQTLYQYEFDCASDSFRVLRVVDYYTNGDHSADYLTGKWQEIVPDTTAEGMFNAVCRDK